MSNANAVDIIEYGELKLELIKTLNERVDVDPWIVIDYSLPNRHVPKGIYTGSLSPACEIIRMLKEGNEECEKSHLNDIIKKTKCNGNGRAQILGCWSNMRYITCPVVVGKKKRVFLVGQRLGSDINANIAATNVFSRLTSIPSFANRLGKTEEAVKTKEDFLRKLKTVFSKVKYMNSEKEDEAKKIVENYARKIKEANLEINFEELETTLAKGSDHKILTNTTPHKESKKRPTWTNLLIITFSSFMAGIAITDFRAFLRSNDNLNLFHPYSSILLFFATVFTIILALYSSTKEQLHDQ